MVGMSLISLARPYAQAAFACAVEEQKLEEWSALLNQITLIVRDKTMQILLKDPRFDRMAAYQCLLEGCKHHIFSSGERFLKQTAIKRRLLILPEIEQLFRRYVAERANQVAAQVVSAIPLTKAEGLALTTVLEKRLQRKVRLDYIVDENLLGGLIVRVDDLVIDSSVRGKLERLRATLVN